MKAATIASWILYVGMTVTMVAGASWPQPRWGLVMVGMLLIGAGVYLLRRAQRAAPVHGDEHTVAPGSIASAEGKLQSLVEALEGLQGKAKDEALAAIATTLESLQTTHVEVVGAAQEDYVRRFGFPAYAAMMAPLASAERWMFRAWSAASDGHRDETINSLREALPYAREALSQEPRAAS